MALGVWCFILGGRVFVFFEFFGCRRRIDFIIVYFFFKFRVVILEVLIFFEDLEEFYDLFKVGKFGKGREGRVRVDVVFAFVLW